MREQYTALLHTSKREHTRDTAYVYSAHFSWLGFARLTQSVPPQSFIHHRGISSREPVRLRHYTGERQNKHSLDPCGEADDREKEAVCVEILKHALNRLPVDPEGDAGSAQVQAAAHHIL